MFACPVKSQPYSGGCGLKNEKQYYFIGITEILDTVNFRLQKPTTYQGGICLCLSVEWGKGRAYSGGPIRKRCTSSL